MARTFAFAALVVAVFALAAQAAVVTLTPDNFDEVGAGNATTGGPQSGRRKTRV